MFQRVSAAPCPHRPPCPGCPRYGEPGIAPRARDALAALAAAAGLPPPVLFDAPGLSSRHRARLMVRGRTRTPKIGLFQLGSHRIVDIPQCRIHHPLINRVAAAVRAAARDAGLEPYADRPHRGALRAIQVVIERRSQSAQLVLVENAPTPGPVAELAAPLARALGAELHSVWWNGNPQRANTILGPAWQHLAGPEVIVDHVAGCEIAFPPGAFGQSHPELAERIAHRVQGCVPDGARVVEFHAGCGPLGMGLLARADRVTFNEVNEARQDRERTINQAQEQANREIPKARGEAARTITEAEGYALERVNRAEGEANRFVSVLTEYQRAPDVTRRRLYLEALNTMLPAAKSIYIVDADQKAMIPWLSFDSKPSPAAGVKP